MFDVSLIELAVIALVALLVLGPEKLPRAARTVGLYVRKAKQSWYSVRADIERELAADELKRSLKQTQDTVRSVKDGAAREIAAATSFATPATSSTPESAPPASEPSPAEHIDAAPSATPPHDVTEPPRP